MLSKISHTILNLSQEEILLIYKILLGMFVSFTLTFISIPKIIRISYKKELMALPGKRSSHKYNIPNLGGIGIFYGVMISVSIFCNQIFQYIFFLPAILILFFIGIMDDILVISPRKKLYAQIISSFLISWGSGIRIDNFFGILGIYEINHIVSILFTVFVIIILINSYNLIDGIDGLAAGIGIIASLSFAFSFYRLGRLNYDNVVFCMIIIGSLLAFLYFNLSKRFKIFMGDTGSLFIGFILSFFMIKFMDLFLNKESLMVSYHLDSAPIVCIAIFIIPLVDTTSIIFIRILNGRGPFKADKNHIHHRYLALGFSHKKTTFILLNLNLLIVILCYYLRHININILLLIVLFLGFLICFAPVFLKKEIKFFKNELDHKPIGEDV